jgi:[CysO sulfur-carrier protein]-S-L-cysteine hydrolase
VTARIHASRDLPRRVIPVRILNEMHGHALEVHPEECCGLLVGRAEGRFEEVHRCRNDMTRLHELDPATWPRDGRLAFHMNEIDYQRVLKQAEAAGRLVTGVYHSHVEAGAYFSELDQEFVCQPLFPFPDVEHVVLSVVEGRVLETAVFRWDPRGERFEGRLVAPEAP